MHHHANIDVSMNKLIALRKKKGLSQRGLAKRSGITNVTIARIETGVYDPRLSTLRRLAKALRVRVADLLNE